MVMWFNVKEAREQLLKDGVVYTLRPKKRREGHEVLMYNGFGKKGDIEVLFIGKIDTDTDLEGIFLEMSGFTSVEAWRKAAGESSFLYRVELQFTSSKPEAKQ